ncbi:MAG: glycosyltransferase [Bacilli bacterium]
MIFIRKYKICVYAICKNEEKFVDRWVDSMQEADAIYVLDTGSTDNTIKKLKKRNVIVKKKIIKPWRFDVARNESLKLVPEDTDICVCTDLDEVFEPGWREKLENSWEDNTTRSRFVYNWSLKDGVPQVSFYYEKTHTRHNYKWINPVHEILKYEKENENIITIDEIVLNHYPDNTKSRSSYLPLLELSVKEDPNNDRNMHYLGREYMYYKRYNEAIDTLIKHLQLPSATWKDERSASMRFISRCYNALGRKDEALLWIDKAIVEAPHLRDPLMEKALLMYQERNYEKVIELINKALEIKINERYYINEVFTFDHTAYDLLSIAYYYTNNIPLSLFYSEKALKMAPKDKRLKKNNRIIKETL